MDKATLNQIFTNLTEKYPDPQTELKYINEFTLAVAVILSAQSTDISVNKATKDLFAKYKTPKDFIELGENGLKRYIKTIGLYNSKAKNIMLSCKILDDKYNGNLPRTFEELIKLPGVGRKTANVILNCAFGVPTIAVDTHVFRVSHRLGFSTSKTPEKVEFDLIKIISKKWLATAHHMLILHGRYVCKARKPECQICPLTKHCQYYKENNISI